MKQVVFLVLLAAAMTAQTVPTSQDRFQGSAAEGVSTGQTIPLSLPDAIARGMKTNLGLLLAGLDVRGAEGARGVARSRLMPNFSTNTSETSEQINLAAFGFTSFPTQVVGPFQIFDTRGFVSQPLLNMNSLYRLRSAAADQKAAAFSSQDAHDLVALTVTNLYLQTVASASRIETGRAQIEVAQAVYNRAVDFQKNGVVPAIEVLRAQVQLQTEQQRLITYRSDMEKLKLRLGRAIGLPDGQAFELTDNPGYAPAAGLKADDAVTRALASRMDYQSSAARVQAAELTRKAAGAERLPTAEFNANYGVIGSTPDHSHGTYTAAVNVTIPVFQGGRVSSELARADAELERRKAELADLRGRIVFEVRSAFIDLTSAGERAEAAKSTVALAQKQLEQSQDRFAAGVTGNLEVVQAQEAVAAANETYIASVFAWNTAKAVLARSMGNAEKSIPSFLQGVMP